MSRYMHEDPPVRAYLVARDKAYRSDPLLSSLEFPSIMLPSDQCICFLKHLKTMLEQEPLGFDFNHPRVRARFIGGIRPIMSGMPYIVSTLPRYGWDKLTPSLFVYNEKLEDFVLSNDPDALGRK